MGFIYKAKRKGEDLFDLDICSEDTGKSLGMAQTDVTGKDLYDLQKAGVGKKAFYSNYQASRGETPDTYIIKIDGESQEETVTLADGTEVSADLVANENDRKEKIYNDRELNIDKLDRSRGENTEHLDAADGGITDLSDITKRREEIIADLSAKQAQEHAKRGITIDTVTQEQRELAQRIREETEQLEKEDGHVLDPVTGEKVITPGIEGLDYTESELGDIQIPLLENFVEGQVGRDTLSLREKLVYSKIIGADKAESITYEDIIAINTVCPVKPIENSLKNKLSSLGYHYKTLPKYQAIPNARDESRGVDMVYRCETVAAKWDLTMKFVRSVSTYAYYFIAKVPKFFTFRQSIPTMGVCESCMLINIPFLISSSLGEAAFTILHESYHIIMKHTTRRKDRSPKLWNLAGDLMINKTIFDVYCTAGDGDDESSKKHDLVDMDNLGLVPGITLPKDQADKEQVRLYSQYGEQCLLAFPIGGMYSDAVSSSRDTTEQIYACLEMQVNSYDAAKEKRRQEQIKEAKKKGEPIDLGDAPDDDDTQKRDLPPEGMEGDGPVFQQRVSELTQFKKAIQTFAGMIRSGTDAEGNPLTPIQKKQMTTILDKYMKAFGYSY